VGRWRLSIVLLALVLVGGAGGFSVAFGDGGSSLPHPFHLQRSGSGENLPLAYLDPGIVLALDVASGRLVLSGRELDYRDNSRGYGPRALMSSDAGVVAIHSPGRAGLWRYIGGIPGLSSGRRSSALALGRAPVWGAPREQLQSGRLVGLVLPDGRHVAVSQDQRHRVVGICWRGPGGARLGVRVRYSADERAITDPFGVTRTYRLVPGGVTRVVPRSWQHTPGYRRPVSRVLDSFRSYLAVQDRAPNDLPGRLTRFGTEAYSLAPEGGLLLAELTDLRRARPVIKILKNAGMLDVSMIVPSRNSDGQLSRLVDRLSGKLGELGKRCQLSVSVQDDFVYVEVATAISPAEGRAVRDALGNLHAWAVLAQHGRSLCGQPA